ncbi:hypothetical protein BZL39_A10150 [Zygosaccharomyces parabailii]|nr:hypothetical protein BZL39_A10150 [Zygosaccharomyces parabailii]
MSSFGAEDFDAKTYSELRPTYPEKFYKILANYHLGPRGLLVDLGCGPGTATLQMADRLSFKRVIGTDLSAIMVQKATFCKELTPESYENVTFMQSPGESFEFLGIDANKQKCDMITAVECVHYFNIEEFEKAIAANLRKDGTIAIWGYGDFFFPDYPYLDAELKHLMSGPDRLGPYWQQPGRMLAIELLKDFHYDDRWFTATREIYFRKEYLTSTNTDSVPLYLSQRLSLTGLQQYFTTWSGYQSWKDANPGSNDDIADTFVQEAKKLYPDLKDDSELQITWETFWKFARRK